MMLERLNINVVTHTVWNISGILSKSSSIYSNVRESFSVLKVANNGSRNVELNDCFKRRSEGCYKLITVVRYCGKISR